MKELEMKVVTATNTSETSVHREKIMCLEKYDGAGKSELMVAFAARAKHESNAR